MYALGASAEYETLKNVVADANKKAASEQALREKHKVRVITAERELQEAVKKSDALEQSFAGKESELAQALQTTEDARAEARGTLKDIQEARKIASGRGFIFLFKAPYVFAGKIHGDPLNPNLFRVICRFAVQHI